MLFGLVLIVHVLMAFVLIGIVLIQGGRGGLSDALGGSMAQSLFGGGAATVLTRLTASCAGLFMVTCLSLAYLSMARGRSVIEQVPAVSPEALMNLLTDPGEGVPSPAAEVPTAAAPGAESEPPVSP